MEIIKDEFEEEISRQKILPSTYVSSRGRTYPMFVLTLEQVKQLLVRESKLVRKWVLEYIHQLENELMQTMEQLENKRPMLRLIAKCSDGVNIKTMLTYKGIPVLITRQLNDLVGIDLSYKL